jgi:sugar phosphate isomerase/epimerase
MSLTRRDFLATSSLAALAVAWQDTARAAEEFGGFRMGAQSYSFRHFNTYDALTMLGGIGLKNMEFCSVHFPPAPENEKFLEAKQYIEKAGVTVPSFGVESFTSSEEASRVKFDFGKILGLEVLTADPDPDAFDLLDKLTEEYNIKIAIHNHGPRARYNKAEDTLKACEGHSAMIGACVDTGHVIRSGEKPHEVLEALGSRVISMHLKDWVHEEDEQILGEGDMDLVAVAKTLKKIEFTGPIMLEFELDKENPVPGMLKGLENWKKALESA